MSLSVSPTIRQAGAAFAPGAEPGGPSPDGAASERAPEAGGLASKEAFLRLLVAQIKNQNPLSPADGVQFLTQLAQFSELEQMIEIRAEIAALRREMESKVVPAEPQADPAGVARW